jgi:hypothetical protein
MHTQSAQKVPTHTRKQGERLATAAANNSIHALFCNLNFGNKI